MGTGIFETALFFYLSVNFFVMIWLEFYYLVKEGASLKVEHCLRQKSKGRSLCCTQKLRSLLPIFETWEIAHKTLVFGDGGMGVPSSSTPTHLSPFSPSHPLLYCTKLIEASAWSWSWWAFEFTSLWYNGWCAHFSPLRVFPVNI